MRHFLMTYTYGAKYGVSELYKMGIGFGMNHFRFYGESEMIHLC